MASASIPTLGMDCLKCHHRQSLRLSAQSSLPLPPIAIRGFQARATSEPAPSQASDANNPVASESQVDVLPDIDDEEWQTQQRAKTRKWHAYRKKEEEAEKRKIDEYRGIAMRLEGYPLEEVRRARELVSSFILAAEEVEEKIEEAGEKGELTELVLMVIWNRLDLARKDEEKDAIRSLDLLYRRVEAEILKRESSPAMKLLNELLNLHDGFDEDWLKKCRKLMLEIFPREDPFSILVPAGFDMDTHDGRIQLPDDEEDILLRIDFIREVDELLKEVREEQKLREVPGGLDPNSVANRLKQEEKQRTICQVESLLELAVNLKW